MNNNNKREYITLYLRSLSSTKHGEGYLLVGSKEQAFHGDTILFQFCSNNHINAKFIRENYTEIEIENIFTYATKTGLPLLTMIEN